MKKLVVVMTMIAMVPVMSACQRTPGEVVNKVLVDFGIEDKPEGYSSMTDQVFARLDNVARAEITRMNHSERNGEVKFEEISIHWTSSPPREPEPETGDTSGSSSTTIKSMKARVSIPALKPRRQKQTYQPGKPVTRYTVTSSARAACGTVRRG